MNQDSLTNRNSGRTYTLVDGFLTAPIATPIPDYWDFEDLATFPLAHATAATALFLTLGVPWPPSGDPDLKRGLLVWGGSSLIGMAMIQIANVVGIRSFVAARPGTYGYLKRLGAAAVVDYGARDAADE